MFKKKNTVLLAIILVFISFYIKIIYLTNITLGQDTTSYIFWLQSLFLSERFFPITLESSNIINSLMLDEKSFIFSLLSPIYSSPTNIFTIVSLIYFYIGSLFISATVESQIILSILANALAIFLLSTFFLYSKKNIINFNHYNKIFVICLFFLLTNSFFYGFSTYGTHNVGIFFLILNLIYLEKYLDKILLDKITFKFRLKYFFIQFLAIYSMYTNVFLVITCASLSIFFLNKNFKIKFYELIKYIILTFIQLLPALILLIFVSGIANENQGFFKWGIWAFSQDQGNSDFKIFEYLQKNLTSWFFYNSSIFGFFSFILSFIGIYLVKVKFKIKVLFYFIISHFLISLLMAAFNYAQARTSAYLLPINSIGLSFFFYFVFVKFNKIIKDKRNYILKVICISLTLIVLIEIGQNISQIIHPTKIKASWSINYEDNNEYKKYLTQLDVLLPNNNLIITDTNFSKIIFSTLNYPSKKLNFMLAFDALNSNKSIKRASLYAKKLNNTIDKKIFYVPLNENYYSNETINKLEKDLCIQVMLCQKKLIPYKFRKNKYHNKIQVFVLKDL
jgi:hypothetical protein